MRSISLAAASAHLSELVERADDSDAVRTTQPSQPVAQLIAVDTPRRRIDIAALCAMTDTMPPQIESARDFIRRMRDADRY